MIELYKMVEEMNNMSGNENIYWHANNLQDQQLMQALSEILKRSTVQNIINLLESH